MTASPILLTGATGFVGRRLTTQLVPVAAGSLRLLVREPGRLPPGVSPPVSVVTGSLHDPASLERAVAGVHTIVHLAALTGKASRTALLDTNAGGTSRLVAAAQRAGVSRFLLVSSIAAGFEDRRWYHYAESKRAAERAVRESGLDWLIVRPTMIFGPESPVQRSLGLLASAPVGVIFGRGDVLVQPIHVDDLVAILVAAVGQAAWGGRVLEVGGPDRLSLAELLRAMRRASRGRSGPLVHLPLGPVRGLLGLIDKPLWRVLPFTAGQLATFANSGVGGTIPPEFPLPSRRLDEMLSEATR